MKLIFRRTGHAFTLIEIMVVVVVLGILAALIIPTIAGKDEKARFNKAMSDVSTLTTLLPAWRQLEVRSQSGEL